MVFSSIEFLFIFFPIFLLCYYLMPKKLRNLLLFVGSILFYAWGTWKRPGFVVLFMISLVFNYFCGRVIGKTGGRLGIVIGVGVNLLYLGSFKYWLRVLPIGISFYTFQAISYLFDVYNKKCKAERSFLNFGIYISMFPQLIAGPIVQYPVVREQIRKRSYTFATFAEGLRILILGLGSKVLLANQVGLLWKQLSVIGYDSISTPLAWLGLFAYTFQIYFDFWGYSLMAIGLGKMLGFELPRNFNYPYLSMNMTEFWRRWHITLGSWFREYVYIPLGGNRGGWFGTYRNLFIVWLLTGIWHGAGWNFALWGFVLFILISLEKAGWKKITEKYRAVGRLYMMLAIPLSWAIFAHNEWTQMSLFFQRLFGIGKNVAYVYSADYIKYGKQYGFFLFCCLLFSTRLPQRIWRKLRMTYTGQIFLAGVFGAVIYCLYLGMDNPFLYYQF